MAKPRAILKRTQSVRNIAKITKTMQMIATAKFKRAHDRAVAARPYTDKLTHLLGELAEAAGSEFEHRLLLKRPAKRGVLLVVSSNRGLCGGYNSNVMKAARGAVADLRERNVDFELVACGKRAAAMLRYKGIKTDVLHTHIEDKPTYADVDALATPYVEQYEAGAIDELQVVYTKFVSAARQTASVEQVLPLEPRKTEAKSHAMRHNYTFRPSAEEILSDLLPRSVRLHLFQAFLDAAVSEQTARMVAMKSATDNAMEMIKDLTMLYNRSRQTQITTELSEIIGGAAALE
jgi:F-type H+-transporting ATPase subunit gamma